jgi:hypothetical protein
VWPPGELYNSATSSRSKAVYIASGYRPRLRENEAWRTLVAQGSLRLRVLAVGCAVTLGPVGIAVADALCRSGAGAVICGDGPLPTIVLPVLAANFVSVIAFVWMFWFLWEHWMALVITLLGYGALAACALANKNIHMLVTISWCMTVIFAFESLRKILSPSGCGAKWRKCD